MANKSRKYDLINLYIGPNVMHPKAIDTELI